MYIITIRSPIRTKKIYKIYHDRTFFDNYDVEKIYADVARSTFAIGRIENFSCWDHFWKLRCRKSTYRYSAKNISKSKWEKYQGFGPLLDIQISFRVAGARNYGPDQNWAKWENFLVFAKMMADMEYLKNIIKDAFSVAVAIQEISRDMFIGVVRRSGS